LIEVLIDVLIDVLNDFCWYECKIYNKHFCVSVVIWSVQWIIGTFYSKQTTQNKWTKQTKNMFKLLSNKQRQQL
jgi:hypothetical protein